MRHRVRWYIPALMFAGALVVCHAPLAWAGTTGKIAGMVSDSDGSPLPGSAVTIDGTRLGATTDADGRFIVLQIPPGEYAVTAQLIGYRSTTITNVRVNIDRTTQMNFTITQEAIEVDALVVTAERPDIEQDVTGSQTIIDAERISEAPVNEMLDYLSYEPGVGVNARNELEIRGGGPSEIRFQVDGMDRTDAMTGNAYTQLNQTLVREVTVLTGGFNAEYGNIRSGVVNAVLKDGTERGFGLPWLAGVGSYAPAQKKHFGPGAYDEDQYDYRIALTSDSTVLTDDGKNKYGPIYWPLYYEQTRTAPEFTDPNATMIDESGKTVKIYKNPRLGGNRIFTGWYERTRQINALSGRRGAYGKKDWTPEELRRAWEWEANMNERVWGYSDEPDRAIDLSVGWALPNKLGGLVFGYVYKKEMTALPAIRPYGENLTFDAKLTLTPLDNLKWSGSFMTGRGSSSAGFGSQAELAASSLADGTGTGAAGIGGESEALTSVGDLMGVLMGEGLNGYNKLNLSSASLLDTRFTQIGSSVTFTVNPRTFATASLSWSESRADQDRDWPRANSADFTNDYRPPTFFGYGTWLANAYPWSDATGDGKADNPTSLADALTPGRAIYASPYGFEDAYPRVPATTRFVTTRMPFVGTDGIPDTATIVSPQGWHQDGYSDLSGLFLLGQGADATRESHAKQWAFGANITHARDDHTFKAGADLIRAELEYHAIEGSRFVGSRSNTNYRDYGGRWPTPAPLTMGFYLQDKFESYGMITNIGIRVERFDAGQNALLADNVYYVPLATALQAESVFDTLAKAAGWNSVLWGKADYARVRDSLGVVIGPWDVVRALPQQANDVHWRIMPRFGISHPVSAQTKFFFNYGIFYSAQKPGVMYGLGNHDKRTGASGRFEQLYNPSIRPAKTTMYEVGVEHVLPLRIVATVRAYSKNNTDQVSQVEITATNLGQFNPYRTYRNSNYETQRGLEIKLARNAGRFINGWITAERYTRRSGATGLQKVSNQSGELVFFTPIVGANQPRFTFAGLLRVGTPADWGTLLGSWAASVQQNYTGPGGEIIYNPNLLERRQIPAENILEYAASYTTNARVSKGISLRRGRQISIYLDILNVFNVKQLQFSGNAQYLEYLVDQRRTNPDLRVGDKRTFAIFTEPYQVKGLWRKPIAPNYEWLLFLNPRFYRLGMSFNL